MPASCDRATAGRGRSHFAAGEFMIHDLENIGDTDMVFTTVEFLDSANAPLDLPADVTAGLSRAA